MIKRIALLVVSTACAAVMAAPLEKQRKPNFLFFMADDLNKEYYGCYGHEKTPAPTTSRLAREGMVFDQAFTGQAICAPSRSMIYTGLYPLRNGAFKNHSEVYKGTKSVCHYLPKLGYDVILCGKSHVNPDTCFPWTRVMHSVESSGSKEKYTDLVIDTTKLERYFAEDNRGNARPFCIMATSYFPHGDHPEQTYYQEKDVRLTRFQEDNERTRKSEARFYQAVKNGDDELAQILVLLDKYNLADNTVVMFASDHGRFGKWSVYDKGLNVPFVVRWPGRIKAGTRTRALVSFADVLPTLLDLAGGDPIADMDGKSFTQVLMGQRDTHQDYVYGVMTNQGIINAHVFPGRMIRSQRYKYIRNYNAREVVERRKRRGEPLSPFLKLGASQHPGVQEEELFDILNDPYEQNNLAQVPAYYDIKSKLKKDLQTWLVAQNDFLAVEGVMPLLAVKKPFRLDLRHPKNKRPLPAELKNSLDNYDFYVHKP
ncbi:sulfatase [Planctomycetota bacterium]